MEIYGIIEGDWKELVYKMKKKIIPVVIIIALIILIGGIYALQIAYEHFSYTKEKADLTEYYNIESADDVVIAYNDEILDTKAKSVNGTIYLKYEDLLSLVSNRFYYGAADNALFYATPTTTYIATVGGSTWTASNGESGDAGFAIAFTEGEELYVALGYAKVFSDMEYESFSDPGRIRLISGSFEGTVAKIKKKTAIRTLGGRKSPIVTTVEGGTALVVEQMDEWSRILTWDGNIGYVENKVLDITSNNEVIDKNSLLASEGETSIFEPIETATGTIPAPTDVDAYTSMTFEGKVNMGFHPIGGIAGNDTVSSMISEAKSLNVIAPTWFMVNDNDGNITSYATNDYVTTAHANNIQVWAVLDDFNSGADIDIQQVLSRESSRANLIAKTMEQALTFGVDGINVDFETIKESFGPDYLQFLRELSIKCREAQLYLSIDDYAPMDFNSYYDLKEQGVVCDYVVIMGYDEHYAGSSEAGSVASLNYVKDGIEKALEDVPAEKLINAIPLYTRFWTTKDGEVKSKALHMAGATNVINEYGLEMSWNDEACQYYGEKTAEDGTLYQIWNEEARSIEAKLSVMQAHNCAGVAEWALGFETPDIWDVIAAYMAQ